MQCIEEYNRILSRSIDYRLHTNGLQNRYSPVCAGSGMRCSTFKSGKNTGTAVFITGRYQDGAIAGPRTGAHGGYSIVFEGERHTQYRIASR